MDATAEHLIDTERAPAVKGHRDTEQSLDHGVVQISRDALVLGNDAESIYLGADRSHLDGRGCCAREHLRERRIDGLIARLSVHASEHERAETALVGERLNPPAVVLRAKLTVTPGVAPPVASRTLKMTVDVVGNPVPLRPIEVGVADSN